MTLNSNLTQHYSWRKKLATYGEQKAAEYLSNCGYTVIAKNWRWGRLGEIDIIANDPDGVLVFVEVKTRVRHNGDKKEVYTQGFESISLQKQHKIMRSAWRFRQTIGSCAGLRFDAIVIIYPSQQIHACYDQIDGSVKPEIIHVPNAFAPA